MKTLENLIEFMEKENIYYTIGKYEKEDHLILDSYTQYEKIEAFVNCSLDEIIPYSFDDEATQCYHCQNIIFYDNNNYLKTDYDFLCNECYTFEDIEDYYINDYEKAIHYNQLDVIILLDNDYKKLNDTSFENGFYKGMNDSPENIYNNIKNNYTHILFYINSNNPFATYFDVYVKNIEGEDI